MPARNTTRFRALDVTKAIVVIAFPFVLLVSALAQSGREGYIGVELADVAGVRGAVVQMVVSGAPADRAGLRRGDIVTAIDGRPVGNAPAMSRLVGSLAPNHAARFTVIRPTRFSARRLTIRVVIGGRDVTGRGARFARNTPRAAATQGSNASSRLSKSAAGSLDHGSSRSATVSVSGYVRLADPLEHAFTVEVPSGWKSAAGLAREAALQIRPYVRSVSPDDMAYLMIGEPTLPSFVPPSQMGNAIGYREGKLYNAGLSGVTMVMRYLPGPYFARSYGETMLSGLCPSLHYESSRPRPDLARKAAAEWPTVIPSQVDGGEARFSCIHHGQEMEARIETATRITRDHVGWGVILLQGFIAPKNQAENAEEILNHVADSMNFNAAWIQKQNNLSRQAAIAINQRMQGIFQQERTSIQSLNSVDENFESMDEIVSGNSSYHDSATGNNYSLSNTNPYKWIDPNTGRIISTPTDTKPLWGPAYVPLARNR
jgi:hypothetical protein